jgi:nucleoside-diphosphate-sugar epimerase
VSVRGHGTSRTRLNWRGRTHGRHGSAAGAGRVAPTGHPGHPGPVRILVTGASGFVGSRLATALDGEGHEVRAMTRRPERYEGAGSPVAGDVAEEGSLREALEGCEVAYYLVHSLDDPDFERKDADAARAFARAAAATGTNR